MTPECVSGLAVSLALGPAITVVAFGSTFLAPPRPRAEIVEAGKVAAGVALLMVAVMGAAFWFLYPGMCYPVSA